MLPDTETVGTIVVGGVTASRTSRRELAERMVADTARAHRGELAVPRIVTSLNGHILAKYHADPAFRAIFDEADLVDVDGMPLVFATRLLCREPLRERVATTDFIHDACAAAAPAGVRFFFLGAKPGVAERAADAFRALYPGLIIAGTRDGYFADAEAPAIVRQIVDAGTDILWLGLGVPKQEQFAIEYRERLAGLAWIRTCGGLFDHYGGNIPRAPMWLQSAGLEWLYRAMREPARLGLRYMYTNPAALYHLLTKTRD
ncbi:WecB/TagA/CpsF family glycosyltransferase [Sphingomonas arantia]|uniref:WecB/TagA/CpsF family glycosyltransferase n=1 Tax=Sphingomonas arantia TaxID=1460676 RepID=A0ABW4TV48_9SPHN